MDARYGERLEALLVESQVDAEVLEGIPERLVTFIEPFTRSILQAKQRRRAAEFIGGLLSDVERKNAESIAYRHDQERKEMQYFLGESQWDYQPLLLELAMQIGRELGRPDGVIVFDPSGFPKKGTESVGVQRQWCGRLGKIENCQVGVYMAYVSAEEHALVNTRLYLPREWAKDKARRQKCHVPREVKFKTRHELCLEMLDEVGHLLPHGWITGDDEMGRSSSFRKELRQRSERYLLAVPSNALIRDLDAVLPDQDGPGAPRKAPFVRADKWRAALPESAWTRIKVRDGEKGPLAGVGAVYLQRKQYPEAIQLLRDAWERDKNFAPLGPWLGYAYGISGDAPQAREMLQEMQQLAKQVHVSPPDLAVIYLGLGAKEEALNLLEQGYRESADYMIWIKVDPIYDALRDDPRFQKLIADMKFPQ